MAKIKLNAKIKAKNTHAFNGSFIARFRNELNILSQATSLLTAHITYYPVACSYVCGIKMPQCFCSLDNCLTE